MRSLKFWSAVLTILVLSGLLLSATAFAASGQDTPPPVVDVSEPVTPKLSPVMRDVTYIAPERKLDREEINPMKNPGLFLPDFGLTGTDTKAKDPLVATGLNALNAPSPLFTFEGQGDFNMYTPPDTTGDVGPDHFVQMVNVETAVYDKSGNLIDNWANNQLWTGFGGPCESDNDGDPIVLYDDMADRWLLSQFAVTSDLYMCLAISTTPDPTGSYYLYGFPMPDFPDYPKLGVWPDGYYLGTNTGYSNQYYAHVFDRQAMLAGDAATRQSVGGQANFLMPADMDGTLPPAAGSPGTFYTFLDDEYPSHPNGEDRLAIFEFDVDWDTPSNSALTMVQEIPIAEFNYTTCGFFEQDCIPQPGTSQKLDGVDPWPMVRLQYRNFAAYEAMVGNFTIDVDGSDHAGIRWFELRRSGSDWALQQEGTFSPDADHRWMGSIAMDGSGNIALGYSVSGAATIPSIRYTVHGASDPLGTMQAEATLMAGGGVQTGPYNRWGDYSSMVVDPTDNCTFWYTNEYHDQDDVSFMWNTRIGAFRVPSCTGSLGETGELNGTVTDDNTAGPIANATISASQSVTQTYTTASDEDGDYKAILPVGTYAVSVSAFGYQPETVTGIEIVSGTVTTQDFALEMATVYTVSGVVTDTITGWPLYAMIAIDGYPGDPIWTDPVDGSYSISLPEGMAFTFNASAFVDGYVDGSAAVGPLTGNTIQNFALNADMVACSAPGYGFDAIGLAESFNATTVPAGWSVVNNGGSCDWTFNSTSTNLTGGTGNFAIADSDDCGSGTTMNTTLYSPIADISALTNVTLGFKYDYNNLSSGEVAAVDVSANGGSTWTTLFTWNASHRGPATYTQDVTALVGGSTQAQLRFRYIAPGWDWWWQVDDVLLGIPPTCLAPTGGLVVGNVYDTNTSLPLVGASVTSAEEETTSVGTPDDPAVEDGFYVLYAEASQLITASLSGGYAPDVEMVSITPHDAVSQDFYLGSGFLSVDPEAFHVTVDMGASTTVPMTLTNSGSAAANFEIRERGGDFIPILAQALSVIGSEKSYSVEADRGTQTLSGAPVGSRGQIQNINTPNPWVVLPAAPTGVSRPAGAVVDGLFYLIGGESTAGYQGLVQVYNPDTNTWNSTLPAMPTPASNLCAAAIGSDIYVPGAGDGVTSNVMRVFHTSNNTWETITTDPLPQALLGQVCAAYDGQLYVFGGGTASTYVNTAYTYDPSATAGSRWTTLANAPVAANFGGTAVIGDQIFWAGMRHATADLGNVYAYLPASNTWVTYPSLTVARGGAGVWAIDTTLIVGGGGWASYLTSVEEYDTTQGTSGVWTTANSLNQGRRAFASASDNENGRLFAVAGWAGSYLTNAESTVFTPNRDILWLSEAPVTGTVATSSDQTIDLTFDASIPEIAQPGDYLARLTIANDTPYESLTVPVTMTVNVPATWGKVAGTVTSLGYCDENPAALEDAQVVIVGDTQVVTLTTDADGYFQYWLDQGQSPLSLSVTADEHIADMESGVIITAGLTTDVDFDLRWLQPCVSAAPGSLDVTLELGDSSDVTMTLSNDGPVTTDYELGEADGGSEPVILATSVQPSQSKKTYGDLAKLSFAGHSEFTGQVVEAQAATDAVSLVLDDGSNEDGLGLTAGGQFVWFNRFTPDPGLYPFTLSEVQMYFDATYGVNVGETLDIYIYEDTDGDGDPGTGAVHLASIHDVEVQVLDDWSTWELPIPLVLQGPGDVLVAAVNRTAGTSAGEFPAAFDDTSSAGRSWFGIYGAGDPADPPAFPADEEWGTLDDIGYDGNWMIRAYGQTGGGDVIWLSEEPVSGTLLADNTQPLTVTFDTTVLNQPGIYYATLNVISDDPTSPYAVPVTMTVNAPATWGKVTGIVTGLGYCDEDPAAIEDAQVVIVGATQTFTTTTDANGRYVYWMDASESPVTLYVTAEEHTDGVRSNVSITAGATTTENFDLRWLEPCVAVDPTGFEVTLTQGYSTTMVLSLTNGGSVDTDFDISEQGGVFPWLSQDVTSGEIEAGGQQAIQVTFDTLDLTLGTYTAVLNIETDDPTYPEIEVPVTMYVMPPMAGIELMPATAASHGLPGETVTYTLHITNTGNASNIFEIAAANNTWDVSVPGTPIALESGEGADFTVTVDIPTNAEEGDFDFVTVMVSGGNAHASSTLITQVTDNPISDVELTPAAAGQDGAPGETVTYTLRVTNTGNVADLFTLADSDGTWDVSISLTSTVLLDAGESVDFTVTVAIPAAAADGEDDAVTITVTGAGGASASSVLTTRATIGGHKVYLPLIAR